MLSGALQADYSQFVEESKKATAALNQMEGEAKKTGATLAKTGQAVDGFGTKAAPNFTQLSTGLRTMDATANALGVNMAKPIAAIEELGRVSGQTYAQLGMLGTAGVAVGVALTGWELGKWISDMTGGLETAKVWQDRLYGSADAADAAANKAAILKLALDRTGVAYTDVNEAIEASNKWIKDHQKEIKTAADRQAYFEGQLRLVGGALDDIEAALENHTATVKQLGVQYGVDAEAITYYIAKKRDEEAATKAATAATAAQVAAQANLVELRKGYGVQLLSINAETLKAVQADLQLGASQAEVAAAYGLTTHQVKAANDQLESQIKVTTGLGAEWANVGEKVKITADSVVADSKRMQDAARAYQAETDRMAEGVQEITPPITAATEATKQWTWQLNEAKGAALSVYEQLQAGMAVMDAYRKATIWTSDSPIVGAYNFQRAVNAGVQTPTHAGEFSRALTVNVNSTEAQNIASKLVTEMRHQGVRF